MEHSKQHSSRNRIPFIFWIVAVIVAFPCAGRLFNYFVPQHWPSESIAELEQLRKELPLAEARWQTHHFSDYDIDMHVTASGTTWCGVFEDGHISFEEPHHLKIRTGEIMFASDNQKSTFNECHLDEFLPPKVFEFLRGSLENADPSVEYLEVRFDSEYGFVSEYIRTPNYRARGWPVTMRFTFSNFRPTEP